jgi:DNA-binding Lrp family transcriptional regulator
MSYPLDATDKAILKRLQGNSRLTLKEIAGQLNLSTTPVFDRIKKLEKAGVISKYVALVDPKKVGKNLTVFINISIKEHDKMAINEFVAAITQFSEVQECHHITGNADFLIKLVLADIEAYNQFILDKLSVIPHIGRVESRFSLSERKSTTVISI